MVLLNERKHSIPSSFRCMTSCASVHRSPARALALNTSRKPSRLNCVDWYVNRKRPAPIRQTTTIKEGLRCSRPNESEKAKMKMIHVDFVIVYLLMRGRSDKSEQISVSYRSFSLFVHRFIHTYLLLLSIMKDFVNKLRIDTLVKNRINSQRNSYKFETPIAKADVKRRRDSCDG